MTSEPFRKSLNLERADTLLAEAHRSGAELGLLPELFNTGYQSAPDFGPHAESSDGPTLRHLRNRSREWGMGIAAGFVECDGPHLYDSLGLCLPDGSVHVYRKRHLVFWELFRFRRGRGPRIVATPWGRVGLAICADMIYRHVWEEYRDRIDIALIASAWPDFAHPETGRPHRLFGHIGPLAGSIPQRVSADLGIAVVFANQSGPTQTIIPYAGPFFCRRMPDRFSGLSCISDGETGRSEQAGAAEQVLLSSVTVRDT